MPVSKAGHILFLTYLSIMFAAVPMDLLHAQDKAGRLRTEMTPADSLRIIELIKKANRCQTDHPDSTILYARMAFTQSLAYNFMEGCGVALGNMATAYRNKGRYLESIRLYRQALSFIERQHQYRDYFSAAARNAMSGAYFQLGMFDSAALNCYRVIALYKNTGSKNINPRGSYVNPLIDANLCLGLCWSQLGYFRRSLEYLRTAEGLSLKDSNRYQLLSILNDKMSGYLGLNELDSATRAATEGIRLSVSMKDSAFIGIFKVGQACALIKRNQNDSAIVLLQQALDDPHISNYDYNVHLTAAFSLGGCYYNKGAFRKALGILAPALREADRRSLRYNTLQAHDILAATYDRLGDTKLAYKELKIKEDLEDTLKGKAGEVMSMMDMALQAAEKDKKIALKQLEIVNQQNRLKGKNSWIMMISAGALVLALLVILLYLRAKQRRLIQEEKIKLLNKEQEVLQLRALMQGEEQERSRLARELHDGFVSQLSAVKMNFMAMDPDHPAPDQQLHNIGQLDETIKELRKAAHNLMPEILLNAGLSEAVQIYCDRINQAHALFADFRVYGFLPRLGELFELPVYRMIQEALQNVIKHSGASRAIIQFNYNNDLLTITVEDNGTGFEAGEVMSKGMGLRNFDIRTRALGGHFHFTSVKGEGTTLYFEFDINNSTRDVS